MEISIYLQIINRLRNVNEIFGLHVHTQRHTRRLHIYGSH